MIVKTFPEKSAVESGSAEVVRSFGKENILMNATARDIEYNNINSPFSLKCTMKGAEWYQVDGVDLLINESNFLILNNSQKYSSYISSDSDVESFCFFFREGIFEEVYTQKTARPVQLLDDPEYLKAVPGTFVEKRYELDAEMDVLLRRIKSELEDPAETGFNLEAHIYNIMDKLWQVYNETHREIETLSSKKKSTKQELYKRIYRAKDFIDSSIGESLELDEVANVACLSKYHFLRSFKELLGIAPHRYITKKRLEKAIELIRNGSLIKEACWEVGFSNQYSFSRLFKNHFGISPSQVALNN